MKLTSDYIAQFDTITFSKRLLGMTLYTKSDGKVTGGKIVETEAYMPDDPAAHSYIGMTNRNKSAFMKPGTIYVYFIYGNYYCVNISSEKEEYGSAILIRALEPTHGIETMMERRKTEDIMNLCSGPGKLCTALDIDKNFDGRLIPHKSIWIEYDEPLHLPEIVETTRIGLSKGTEALHRFYIKGNTFISKI